MPLEEVIEKAREEYIDGDYVGTLEMHQATAVRKHYGDKLKCVFCNKEGLTLSELAEHLWGCEEWFKASKDVPMPQSLTMRQAGEKLRGDHEHRD